MTQTEPPSLCCHCGSESNWNYEIHPTSDMTGKTLPLCDECGSDDAVTPEMIWTKLRQTKSQTKPTGKELKAGPAT